MALFLSLWIKLFFVLTGLETAADFGELASLGRSIAARLERNRGRCRVVWSFTPLHVAPHTPLAFRGAGADSTVLAPLCREVERIGARHGIEVRVAANETELVPAQILAVGDRRVTPALCRSFAGGKGLYDTTLSAESGRRFLAELGREDLTSDSFLFARTSAQPFPWDDIRAGASRATLARAYARIANGDEAAACIRGDAPPDCGKCGICATATEKHVLQDSERPVETSTGDVEAALAERQDPARLYVLVDIEPRFRHVPPAFWPRAVARTLMLTNPKLVDSYLGPDDLAAPPIAAACGHRWLFFRFKHGAQLNALSPAGTQEHLRGARLLTLTTTRPPAPSLLDLELRLPEVSAPILAAAIQAPGAGRPLPLTLTRDGSTTLLKASGARGRRSAVLQAIVSTTSEGAHALVRCRVGFDAHAVLFKAYDRDRHRARAASITVRFANEAVPAGGAR